MFTFTVPLDGDLDVEAFSGLKKDTAHFHKVDKPNPAYKLVKNKNAQSRTGWITKEVTRACPNDREK